MRVFVTGVKGQLGYDVMNELEKQGLEGIGVDIDEMDITDADQVNEVIKEAAPDAVIHWQHTQPLMLQKITKKSAEKLMHREQKISQKSVKN